MPKATPDGDYLLRVEHIALHMASQANKAQFYLACSQIKVTGGGSGTPGPLVQIPVYELRVRQILTLLAHHRHLSLELTRATIREFW
jgi:hypothetical protein